eukprot:scaffold44262_cov52-Attheya_sp.AAC.4
MNKQFLQTFSLNRGIREFGTNGKDAAHKEMKQLHDRTVFELIRLSDMNPVESKRAFFGICTEHDYCPS